MRPSVTSGIYFLVFMGAATAWAVGRPLERGFAVVSRCVMAIMGVHIAVLLVYQCTWIIEIFPPETDMARSVNIIFYQEELNIAICGNVVSNTVVTYPYIYQIIIIE